MKIGIILGTRPEIIKMSPIIRECEKQNLNYFILHTNQHYSENMDKIFFNELKLKQPKYNLNIGSGKQGEQTGKMLKEIEQVLINEKPDIVLVQGDTNTVLAGALSASKLSIKIGHIEAGLRSYDRSMPEEINRIMTDHLSDFLFVPTNNQKKILLNEGIEGKNIYVVGNTIVDAVFQNIAISKKTNPLEEFKLDENKYFLVTIHRAENTDNKKTLNKIFKAFEKIYAKYKIPLFYPIHPRTEKMIQEFKLSIPKGLIIVKPIGYLKFLQFMEKTKLILTDSGGIQEEACILKVPCVTIRENTERPETVEVGANIIAGINKVNILDSIKEMININPDWNNPFGEGDTAKKILEIIKNEIILNKMGNGK